MALPAITACACLFVPLCFRCSLYVLASSFHLPFLKGCYLLVADSFRPLFFFSYHRLQFFLFSIELASVPRAIFFMLLRSSSHILFFSSLTKLCPFKYSTILSQVYHRKTLSTQFINSHIPNVKLGSGNTNATQ